MAGLDDMPKIHERTRHVDAAEAELSLLVATWIDKHKLTYGEVLRAFGGLTSKWATRLIRSERHPNEPGKRGDEA